MNNNHGYPLNRTTKWERIRSIASIALILALCLLTFVVVFLVLTRTANGLTNVPLLALSPWLRNPMQTTRKMKVPYHFRQGHSERITNHIAVWVMRLVGLAVGLAVIDILMRLR